MPTEVEIKLSVSNLKSMGAQIRQHGWRVSSRRKFEANWLFDCVNKSLQRSDHLLRVRQSGRTAWLTVKGPVQQNKAHKIRNEIEIEISNANTTITLLETLGYSIAWRYEKYRRCFTKTDEPGKILLDETPIGNYLELEGSAIWIDNTSVTLGFSRSDYIIASYRSLFEQYRRSHSVGPNMIFDHRIVTNSSDANS